MTKSEIEAMYEKLHTESPVFYDIYGAISEYIAVKAYEEDRPLNSDEQEWLSENIPF